VTSARKKRLEGLPKASRGAYPGDTGRRSWSLGQVRQSVNARGALSLGPGCVGVFVGVFTLRERSAGSKTP